MNLSTVPCHRADIVCAPWPCFIGPSSKEYLRIRIYLTPRLHEPTGNLDVNRFVEIVGCKKYKLKTMSLTKNNLLNLLDSIHEPVSKKLKIVDHAFKSSQLLLPHKEAFLLKWIIGYSEKESKETWKILYDWVHSDQFKELNRNDMDNNEISAIIECLFNKNPKTFSIFLNIQIEKQELPIVVLKNLIKIYKEDTENTNELSLKKSQRILLELLDVFSHINNQLDIKVNEESFTEFLRNILKQLLFLKTPSSTSYKIFMKAIIIDPVVIEPMIDSIIRYAMTADNREQKEDYESLIIAVFDVYSKLHRIESLVAKIVSTLRSFSTCVCNLASWQVINVFKTLLYYLNKHLSCINKVENEDFKYFIYMEILSVLIGTLLASIRVAEHTVATNVVEKSVKELEELRNILQNFGVALLNRQHNHILMKSFLNIAYHWGELYTVLAYYSINNEVEIVKSVDNDFTSCNITYLHSYLNVKQWCLISERITNFGELPCKQKHCTSKKLKAMFLFEKSINEDIIVNVIKGVTTDVEISCKDIICDKYVVNHLMCKMDFVTILPLAECVINNIDSFEKQLHIHDSSLFITAINYICIVKLNKLMLKHKRKLNDDIFNITLSSKICSTITEDILDEKGHEEVLQKVKKIYHTENIISESERKINDKKACNIFEKLKKISYNIWQ
ncbi:hypothetical protein NQ317_010328 [Molorchus minor]|uniref:Uncharacterized protein n=1 Tax=Molorchus minor TaxID=1323400 RepID=A0ABQ9J370_9CUCU|nr:hypothetical protein NQ317_010328 [Molorchus minor]